jgi:eukaryotic-like serine/threonine-protein kinase
MADAHTRTERLGERYALYGEIASGGMATVHFGRLVGAVGFSRTVAIKRLHSQYASEPDFVSMFVDEARLAARVRHPNVVATIDVVASENLLYLVMEYVQGESLAKLARTCVAQGGRVPRRIATAIMLNMLQGLHAAHEAKNEKGDPLGIVHRDVSPQNVLVGTDGVARVIDFGIAKAATRASVATDTGHMKGKPAYMAPEQIMDKNVTRLADIYAASVVYWELLTGERLFLGKNDVETINRVLRHPVDPPSAKLPSLLPALDEIVLRGLERDPTKRFATAREMAKAIEDCIAPASASDVGEWVEKLAGDVLALRERRLKEIEDRATREPAPDEAETTVGPPPALLASLVAKNRQAMQASAEGPEPGHTLPMRQAPSSPDATPGPIVSPDSTRTPAFLAGPGSPLGAPPQTGGRPPTPASSMALDATLPIAQPVPGTMPLGQSFATIQEMSPFGDLVVPESRVDADRLSIPTPGNLELRPLPPPTPGNMDFETDTTIESPKLELDLQPGFALGDHPKPPSGDYGPSYSGVTTAEMPQPKRRSKAGWVLMAALVGLLGLAGGGAYELPGYALKRCVEAAAREGVTLTAQGVAVHPHGVVLSGVKATAADLPTATASARELEVSLSGLTPQGVTMRDVELTLAGPVADLPSRVAAWRAASASGDPVEVTVQAGHVVWSSPFGPGTQLEAFDASAHVTSAGKGASAVQSGTLVWPSVMLHTPRANLGPWQVKVAQDAAATRVDVALDPSAPEWATAQVVMPTGPTASTMGMVVPRSAIARLGIPQELLGAGTDASTQIEGRVEVAASKQGASEGRASLALYGVRTTRGPADVKLELAMAGQTDPWAAVGSLSVGAVRGKLGGTLARPGPGLRLQVAWKPSSGPCDAEQAAAPRPPPDDAPPPPTPTRHHGRAPPPPPPPPAPAPVAGSPLPVTLTLDARDLGAVSGAPSGGPAPPKCLLGILPLP